MPRRWFAIGLPLMVLVPLLASGCLSRGLPRKGDEVLLMVPAHSREKGGWEKGLEAFTEETKIKVSLVTEADSATYRAQLEKLLPGRGGPDIALVDYQYLPYYAAKGCLTDLRANLRSQQSLKPSAYYPLTWDACRYGDTVVALPFDFDVYVLVANTNQTDLCFVTIPPPPMTWQQFAQTAKGLTRTDDTSGKTTYGASVVNAWPLFVWQNGGELVDNPLRPTRSTLSTPQAQGALQYLADLAQKQKVTPPAQLTAEADDLTLFKSENAAMALLTHRDMPRLEEHVDFTWGATEAPRGKVKANMRCGGGFVIPRSSPQAQKAWRLLAYLAGEEGQANLAQNGIGVPALKEVAESTIFAQYTRGAPSPFLSGMTVARSLPVTPLWPQMEKIYKAELARLWSGQATVGEVCKSIDEQINKLLGQAGK